MAAQLPALANLRSQIVAAEGAAEPIDVGQLPRDLVGRAPTVTFEKVTVVRGARAVLRDVDLTLPAGRTIAFVGSSGAGKSTLVEAILGLVPLAGGRILIGEHDLASLPLMRWRQEVGYIGQDTLLLGGTITQNVTLGNAATSGEVEDALRRASADFVFDLACGLSTLVGDRGSSLSGGERQRIGVARALAARRHLFVLDEATSALDAETEAAVSATFASFTGRATVLIVAHRFSAIRCADIIHVIDDGRVAESGNWSDLDRLAPAFGLYSIFKSDRTVDDGTTRPDRPQEDIVRPRKSKGLRPMSRAHDDGMPRLFEQLPERDRPR